MEICTKQREETLQGFRRVEAEGLYEQHSLTVSVDGVAFSELGALAVVLPFIYSFFTPYFKQHLTPPRTVLRQASCGSCTFSFGMFLLSDRVKRPIARMCSRINGFPCSGGKSTKDKNVKGKNQAGAEPKHWWISLSCEIRGFWQI